jgi:uncharacterized membrane protein
VSAPVRASFLDDFRRFFVRGLATLLPTLITLVLLFKFWEILWDYLGRHIITALKWLHVRLLADHPHPIGQVKWWWDRLEEWQIELLGVGLAVILVYIVGLFVGHILGRTAWRLLEMGVLRIPLVRAIYPAVKQVTDFLLTDRTTQLRSSRVVAVQPHASGIWSLGLVTGEGVRSLSDAIKAEMVTVFVPSSPTAFTGYVLVVPREQVVELPLTVEEAMRLLITGGVSGPSDASQVRESTWQVLRNLGRIESRPVPAKPRAVE